MRALRGCPEESAPVLDAELWCCFAVVELEDAGPGETDFGGGFYGKGNKVRVHEEQLRFDVCQLVDDLCGPVSIFSGIANNKSIGNGYEPGMV